MAAISANGFTYTITTRNANGAVLTATRNDGVIVQQTDPDYQSYQQASVIATAATAAALTAPPLLSILSAAMTPAQLAAAALAASSIPPGTSDLVVRVAAIESQIRNSALSGAV